jgi:glucuronate isomerase
MAVYQSIEATLQYPAFRPRGQFERFRIEVLATSDAALGTLHQYMAIAESG